MRDTFKAYYPPTDDELDKLWQSGFVVLDTNALLNLFRYSTETRDEFLGVLDKLQESLWIPHQVGLEFHQRRLGVISMAAEAFSQIQESLQKANKDIVSKLNEYKHHPSLSRDDLADKVNTFFSDLSDTISERRQNHDEKIINNGDAEQTFTRISDLFSGRVGEAFSEERLEEIYTEGKNRYEKEIPPGYKDSNKPEPKKYGDLIIWKEILKLGAESKSPVIFVTDDTKDDWWRSHRGETQGPRVELIEEFWDSAEQRIHFYEPLRFMKFAQERTDTKVSQQSLEEIEEVSNASTRPRRVLQDRKMDLESKQAHLQHRIQREKSHQPSTAEHHKLAEERESLADEERNLEYQLDLASKKATSLIDKLTSQRSSESDLQISFEDYNAQAEHARTLEERLITTQRSREKIERHLRRGHDQYHHSQHFWDSQLAKIQKDLEEVNLALAELDE